MCPDASREDNIAKQSPEVPLEQWIAFVDYRARPTTKVICIQWLVKALLFVNYCFHFNVSLATCRQKRFKIPSIEATLQ